MSSMNTRVGNRYQLVREIGAGKMGRVYQAVDTETGTSVAAKVLTVTGDDGMERLLRFYQEAAVLSTLKHPNIVQVHGTFLEQDSSWIIMEFLEGRSLLQLLAVERLSLVRIKHLMTQVAAALAYAHERDIVHRDIKPDNIMVLPDDRVKVTDFGLARIFRPGTTLATMTKADMTVHGLLYMAPERIEGIDVDARADIYSLGAVMHHILTGRAPFQGPDPLTIAFKTVSEPPPSPRSLNPHVPADWDALILKTLQKNPADRFQSAGALEEALSALSPQVNEMDRRADTTGASTIGPTVSRRTPIPADDISSRATQSRAAPDIASVATWWERGRVQERAGDLDGAIESYRTGLSMASAGEMQHDLQLSVVRVLREQGRAKQEAGDVSGALDAYRTALAAAPSGELPSDLIETIHVLSTSSKPTPTPARQQAAPILGQRRIAVLGAAGIALIVAGILAFLYIHSNGGSSTAGKTAVVRTPAVAAPPRTSLTAAQDRARVIAEAAQLHGTGQIFGPDTGTLTSTIYYRWASLNLRDFVARVRFVNPPVLPQTAHLQSHRWGYGLWFRNYPDGGQFRLMLYSDKRYELISHVMRGDTMGLKAANTGSIPNLNVSPGDSNDVTLFVDGKTGTFSVNGRVISTLDLSSKMDSGGVGVIAGAPWSNGLGAFNQPLRYENFTVWSLAHGQAGPSYGALSATGPRFAGLWTINFIAAVRLDNPPDRSSRPWDYGVAFRHTPQVGELRLIFNSKKEYELRLHDPAKGISRIAHGPVPSMNVAPHGHNDVTLFVDNKTGILVVNGRDAVSLDLSAFTNGGDVGPGYGPLSDGANFATPLHFEKFIVWPLIEAPQTAPSTSSSAPATEAQAIDGIPCQSHLKAYKTFFHLAITNAGKPVFIPAGIGVNPDPTCFYWLHSAAGGLGHVTWPTPYTPPLGDFFDIWRQPLSRTQVASARVGSGQSMKVYVNSKLYSGDPRAIPLAQHAIIDIQVGPPFHSPRPYTFQPPKK